MSVLLFSKMWTVGLNPEGVQFQLLIEQHQLTSSDAKNNAKIRIKFWFLCSIFLDDKELA